MEENKDIRCYNRIKVVLAEQMRTNKWLAEQLGKDPATVSKWCTNSSQPGIELLFKIAEVESGWRSSQKQYAHAVSK